ncbi:MAG: hypothetical protein JO189_16410 [Deltaproteobacteria bacterium]|nr:hypothetical protein [Deltaproteobacteria bacterium]
MRLIRAAALMLTACAICLSAGFATPPAPPTRHTEVIIFRPPLLPQIKAEQGGRCWTESIAVNRPGVWRCMDGNLIYDPCFKIAGRNNQVICGANPVRHENGFALALTQPLLPRSSFNIAPQPWLIELADGAVCEAATGTMAVIGSEPVRYPCSVSPSGESQTPRIYCGLLSTLHPGKVWTAEKVCFTVAPSDGGPPFKLLSRESIVIRRIWE